MLMEKYAHATFKDHEDFMENYHINVPENYNFAFDCIDELARTSKDKVGLVWCNDKGDEAKYTFGELAELADASARYFLSLGIKKGDPVMLVLKRRAQFWFALLGLIKIGAVAIPATHQLTKADIVYRNNAASTAAIIAVEDEPVLKAIEEAMPESPKVHHLIKLGTPREGWHNLDDGILENMSGETLERVTKNDDMMLLYFTSGTTGLPKMVTHNYTYPLGHIVTARYWEQLHENSLHFTLADTGWAKAAWGKIFGQWLCESAIFVYDHDTFNAQDLLDVIQRYQVTSFCAPPTVFRFLIKRDLSHVDLSSLEHVTTAGEPLNAEVYNQFERMTGLRIHEGYGQTETTPLVFTSPYIAPRPGALGKINPAYDLRLLDESDNEVGINEEGEICIHTAPGETPGVFTGYYRDQSLTDSVWHDGFYHTGDIAIKDEEGYLWFVGRVDDVIKSCGYRIGPFEVESVLMQHPAVMECAVTGTPDPKRGQAIKASIVLVSGQEPTEYLKRELKNFVKNITSAYKCPKVIEFVTELPKTISGKIQRVVIRECEEPSK